MLIYGDRTILPGTELLLTPGHTLGLQSVAVPTNQRTAVPTLDCAHVHQSFEIDLSSSLMFDLPGWMRTPSEVWRKVPGKLGLLFSGHVRDMFFNDPRIAEDANTPGVGGDQT